MRAAMATGQSMPGAMIPSTCSARASWLIAASSSTETTARRSACSKPTAVGIAVAGDDVEPALPGGPGQPQLGRPGAED